MVSRKSAIRSIPIAKSYFDKRESVLVSKVIASGWISQGKIVEEFEKALTGYAGAKYAIAVSSGTTALHLALLVSGVGPGDEVIVPSFSFIATANAVLYCAARPIFIDIDSKTYNVDPLELTRFLEVGCRYDAKKKRLVNKKTGGIVKAIMPVHQFGLACDLSAIERVAKKFNLALIEDAACGLGALYKGRKIGDGRNIACLSFHPRKIITTGEGGAILTNNRSYADKLRTLRNHGACLTAMDKHASKTAPKEDYEVLGYNYRMTDLQAAIGLGQMSKLSAIVQKRKAIAARYNKAFKDIRDIHIPYIPYYATPNYQSYIISLDERCPISRDAIVTELASLGISTRRGNTAIHMQGLYRNVKLGVRLPITEKAAFSTIALPIYAEMTKAEQGRVISSLLSVVSHLRQGASRKILSGIRLRKVIKDDCREMFEWRNDPETRKNSILGSREVSFDEHQGWFYSKMNSPHTRLFMAMSGDDKVGVLRFVIGKDAVEAGININPHFRRMGIGKKIINLASQKMLRELGKPLIAKAKNDNTASIKLFNKCGYRFKNKTDKVTTLCLKGCV